MGHFPEKAMMLRALSRFGVISGHLIRQDHARNLCQVLHRLRKLEAAHLHDEIEDRPLFPAAEAMVGALFFPDEE